MLEWPFFIDLDRAGDRAERHKAALQRSALARRSELGSVVVKATPQVRWLPPPGGSIRPSTHATEGVMLRSIAFPSMHVREIERNWQKG